MLNNEITLVCESSGRIDKLINIDGLSRSSVQNLLLSGQVTCNGKIIAKNHKANIGDVIAITIPEPKEIDILAENIPLDIRYEDDDLLVINKQKGMVVHPAPGHYTGTLVNALMYHCKDSLSGINGELRPGIVHRIDMDTSGLLIVAKNDFTHQHLAAQIKAHSFKREYASVVHGKLKEDIGIIDAPIGRNPKDRKKMAVIADGYTSRNAVTHYEVLERLNSFTYAIFRLETGRTHQIRVHMAYNGTPVAGDVLYGPKRVITELGGQCLHAKTIGFVHPRTCEYIEIESELPEYFKKFLKKLGSEL